MGKKRSKSTSGSKKNNTGTSPKNLQRDEEEVVNADEVKVDKEEEEEEEEISENNDKVTEENDITEAEEVNKAPEESNKQVNNIEPNDKDLRIASLEQQLAQAQSQLTSSKEQAAKTQNNYNALLSRISSMKTVFQKMKEAQEQLTVTQDKLEEVSQEHDASKDRCIQLEQTNKLTELKYQELLRNHNAVTEDFGQCQEMNDKLNDQIYELETKLETIDGEWRNKVVTIEQSLKEREMLGDSMQEKYDEVVMVLSEANAVKKALSNEVQDLKNLINDKGETIDRLTGEIGMLERTRTTDLQNLQKRLGDMQKTNQELSGTINEKDKLLDNMQKQAMTQQEEIDGLQAKAGLVKKLEQEVKEKQLQIGKLRHEAIILNEHLTKALAMIQKSKESDMVDKELISNLVLKFVALPRGDSKKFEVLSLIGSLLDWTGEQKVQAGLIHEVK
ncbi:Rud3 protein [Saccharomycopsis crataegensis]|uniref:Rud3 protein n=1 Tax=Saccharomycopsis crataegensis TaxID=43959 RepID=A0AAV5QRT4_9ASCO|nr:Rud3 protein [Saccharomycopsis crataegensis]